MSFWLRLAAYTTIAGYLIFIILTSISLGYKFGPSFGIWETIITMAVLTLTDILVLVSIVKTKRVSLFWWVKISLGVLIIIIVISFGIGALVSS